MVTTFTVITHYAIDDPDCDGDYVDVELKINGFDYYAAGDYYHEKGDVLVEGYIDGWLARDSSSRKDVEIVYEHVADREV